MTTIIPLLEEMTSDTFTASSGQSAQQKSKWLYELERAQWQAKQLPAHFERNLPKSMDSDTSSLNRLQQQAAKSILKDDIESPQSANQQLDLHPDHAHIQQLNSISGTKISLPSRNCATGISIAALIPIPLVADKTPANSILQMESVPSMTSTDRKWDKLRTHLEKNEDEINLWLRDTRMDSTQGIQLATTLRKRFAEMGYRLACFTLNGRTLPLDPPVTTLTHS